MDFMTSLYTFLDSKALEMICGQCRKQKHNCALTNKSCMILSDHLHVEEQMQQIIAE